MYRSHAGMPSNGHITPKGSCGIMSVCTATYYPSLYNALLVIVVCNIWTIPTGPIEPSKSMVTPNYW